MNLAGIASMHLLSSLREPTSAKEDVQNIAHRDIKIFYAEDHRFLAAHGGTIFGASHVVLPVQVHIYVYGQRQTTMPRNQPARGTALLRGWIGYPTRRGGTLSGSLSNLRK